MRGVPESAAITREAVTTPYKMAITPQAMTAQRTEDIVDNLLFLRRFQPVAEQRNGLPRREAGGK
jgi:hypothetical protein